MDDADVTQTVDGDVAADVKRWPLVVVAAMFLAGVAPAFLSRPEPPPPPTSGKSCTSTAPVPANPLPHTESPKTIVDPHGTC